MDLPLSVKSNSPLNKAECGIVSGSALTLVITKHAVAKAANCDWMFNQLHQMHLYESIFHMPLSIGPMRWSAFMPIEEAIRQFEELKHTIHRDRAVIVRVPAGILSEEKQ